MTDDNPLQKLERPLVIAEDGSLSIACAIDNKFHVEVRLTPTVSIIKTSNGDAIQPDEPLFLMRGRDRPALPLLKDYREMSIQDGCTDYHMQGLDAAIAEFERFAREQADKMKQPGITRGL